MISKNNMKKNRIFEEIPINCNLVSNINIENVFIGNSFSNKTKIFLKDLNKLYFQTSFNTLKISLYVLLVFFSSNYRIYIRLFD